MAAVTLFSASEQTHCPLVICNSEWVTVALHNMFWISTKVVTVLFGCYTTSATWNCCRLGAYSVYTIQPCSSYTVSLHWKPHLSPVSILFPQLCGTVLWMQKLEHLQMYCRLWLLNALSPGFVPGFSAFLHSQSIQLCLLLSFHVSGMRYTVAMHQWPSACFQCWVFLSEFPSHRWQAPPA